MKARSEREQCERLALLRQVEWERFSPVPEPSLVPSDPDQEALDAANEAVAEQTRRRQRRVS